MSPSYAVAANVAASQCQFPVRIVIPQGFPSLAPKVILTPDAQSKAVTTSYLNGNEVLLSAVLKWTFNPNPAMR